MTRATLVRIRLVPGMMSSSLIVWLLPSLVVWQGSVYSCGDNTHGALGWQPAQVTGHHRAHPPAHYAIQWFE